jgi:hypothetical protein
MIEYISGKLRKLMLPNGEEHKALYAIVDLNDIRASHNEVTFNDTVGYPTENGRNINDRNYKDDVAAQRNVQKIARELVPETLISLSSTPSGTPIINKDGFVVSGNNRVMSLKLAVKEYPDNYNKYVKQLAEDIDVFGLNDAMPIDMGSVYHFRHKDGGKIFRKPILVRIDESLPEKLTTEILASYNQETKKGERPVDKAIKLAAILNNNDRCRNAIVSIVDGYDTFSDLYSTQGKTDRKKLVDTFVQCGLIPEAQLPIYFDNGEFTEGGKDYIETLLSAIILTPDGLKVIGIEGVKKYRQTLISSLPVLISNKALKEDSLTNDISDAVVLQYKIVQAGGDFSDFTHSQSLFSEDKPKEKALYLNALLRAGKNTFKAAIKRYTDSVKDNEGSSLFGEVLPVNEIFDKTIIAKVDSMDKKLIEQLYKKEEQLTSKEEQFELKAAKTVEQLSENVDSILFGYADRKMANMQAMMYIHERKEIGEKYLKINGIKDKDDFDKFISARQSKLRTGKGKERTENRKVLKEIKEEAFLDKIFDMATRANDEMEAAIERKDKEDIAQKEFESTKIEKFDDIKSEVHLEPNTKEPKKELAYYKGVEHSYRNPYEYKRAVEDLVNSKETFTPEEKVFMSNYSGYGGLQNMGTFSDKELKGLLYEFFTPTKIVEKMWGLAYKHGFTGGEVLEPSIGVGEFAKFTPDISKLTGYEINPISAKICKILFPLAKIINEAFETIFIKNRSSIKGKIDGLKKYSLIIGNPPYGKFGGIYAGMGEDKYTNAQNYIEYFMTRGLDILESKGLLIMIIGTEVALGGKPFLSKGLDQVKKDIMEKANLLDAYRLPNGIFDRTDALTDIIVLQKK